MNLKELSISLLEKEGATIDEMAKILVELQKPYKPDIQKDKCAELILDVLSKREVQHAVITGIELDNLATSKMLSEPLQSIVEHDESLYGIDEIIALSITNVYGSIGLTNFGYLDKTKPGIIGKLDNKYNGKVHTFIDDIVCALVAAAASKLAHTC